MIGFSIMMWFVSFVIFAVSISLFRGNISYVHGKVFDSTDDKKGYCKQLGKPCLLVSIGLLFGGIIGISVKSDKAILYSLAVILITTAISAVWFVLIQRRYKN